jgi:hypothetical protein
MAVDDITRRAIISLLKNGEISIADGGRLAGTSRQAVQQWARAERIDAAMARQKRLKSLLAHSKAMGADNES